MELSIGLGSVGATTDSVGASWLRSDLLVNVLVALRAATLCCVLSFLTGSAVQAETSPDKVAADGKPASQEMLAAAHNQAAVVILVEGDARLAQGNAKPRAVKVGDAVNEGDLLITAKDGELHLAMRDSGFIALRANTRFKVVTYKADGGEDDSGIFRLVSGGFRSITGWIGRYNSRGYQVRTPTATIGIRGTDHEPHYIPEGSMEGEPGTYDRVFAGQSYIESSAGQATIAPNQAGFVSVRPQGKPRLLAEIPGFFRRGPHETEIEKKHEEIQRQIDQRREERRKVIDEKRIALTKAQEQAKALQERTAAELAQAKQQAQEENQATKEEREALQQDTHALENRVERLKKQREALQEVLKSGQITRPELRQRRKAMQEETAAIEQTQADLKRRRRELQESIDARIDERFKATQDRQQGLHDLRLGVREKRKDLAAERDSAEEEIKGLKHDENQRYRDELKADRKTDPSSAADDAQSKTR